MESNRLYKVYPVSQANSLDWSKFTQTFETCLKSLDGTQFIVQFKETPHANTITLTHSEAMALKQSPDWKIVHHEATL